jgi:hypothetical protein
MVKIFCEGDDDVKFIRQLLYYLRDNKLIPSYKTYDSFIKHKNAKKNLLNKDNYKIESELVGKKFNKVLFVFDCDFEKDDKTCGGMKNSKKCIESLINELGWDIPVDYYIFDKNLDYFLIETIKDKKCYENFESLINCLELEEIKPNKKPIANLYKDLYPYPKFDFEHKNFEPLKEKLKALFE